MNATPSGLPIPRFVSLRSSEVNLRVGPGYHFPTEWVYNRATFPMEIIAEFGDWRKIKDLDGTEGWVHKSLLSGHRFVTIIQDKTPLRSAEEDTSTLVAHLQNGVLGKLLKCRETACYLEIQSGGNPKGWVSRSALWGVNAKD